MYNSHFRGNWYRIVFTLLLCVIIGTTLLTSSMFIYASLTPFYSYLISVSLAIILTGLLFVVKPVRIQFSWPIIIAIAWLLYILAHGFGGGTLNSFHVYLIVSLIFLVVLNALFQIEAIQFATLFKAITLFAAIEALLCIGQFFGIIKTYNDYFTVTGSWENPNVTAMFLALTIPVMLHLIISGKSVLKLLSIGILSLTIIALLLLQCRTALIGSLVAVFILINYRYGVTGWLTNKRNRSVSIVIGILFIAVAIPTISYLYNAKKASADGRKLVWKLSAQMILDKPISGYGYGLFEKNYNVFQSNYFKTGNGSYEEIQQADYVHMAYNEFLENAVQGGVLGLLFIGALFLVLLRAPIFPAPVTSRQSKDEPENYFIVAYAGIAAFAAMSLCNFTVQAIPAMCLFILYASCLSAHPSLRRFPVGKWERPFNLKYSFLLNMGVVFLGLFLLYQNVSTGYASVLNKRAATEAKHGNNQSAIQILSPLAVRLTTYESYWTNLALIYMAEKDYITAITLFDKAKAYTSDPLIFVKTAICYQKIGDYQNAENNYLFAKYAEPSRLSPKVALMNLYWKQKDTIKAVIEAREIIGQKLKIPSKQASRYKYQAQLLLKELGKGADTRNNVTLPAFLHKSI